MRTQTRLSPILGITLIEMMLVLAIMTSIILMAFSWFQTMQIQNNYITLKSNVDQLLASLRAYYQANCDVTTSKFYPTSSPIQPVLPIDLTTDMKGFINTNWPKKTVVVASDTDTGEQDTSYLAQFNLYLPTGTGGTSTVPKKFANFCFQFDPTKPAQCADPVVLANSKLFIWQIQVVVKMSNPEQAFNYRALAGADCVATEDTYDSTTPVDCAANATNTDITKADYLVWQRAPAQIAPELQSSLAIMNPVVREFKLQYTHDPMYEMSNPDTNQNYLCGGS